MRLRVAAAVIAATALAVPAIADAQGVDSTCVLPLTKVDAATANTAFPDEAAQYWTGAFASVPGLRLRITGEYPHARYMSFNVYDPALRPFDALADIEIGPDPGSSNPFVAGASRTTTSRQYTAFLRFIARPAQREPNALYGGSGQNGLPNPVGYFIYRLYTPDSGRDETGDAAVPTVTLEQDSPGGGRPPRSACAALRKPSVGGLNEALAANDGVAALDGAQPWGRPQPVWAKFANVTTGFADFLLSNPTGGPARPALDPVAAAGGSGGFLSNQHNAYVATAVNRAYGKVLLTRFRAPTFPATRGGAATMAGGQVRYFSLCQNEFFSQRFIACRADDQSAIDRDGFVNYVLSTPAQRPSRATAACGYTWMPWAPMPRAC